MSPNGKRAPRSGRGARGDDRITPLHLAGQSNRERDRLRRDAVVGVSDKLSSSTTQDRRLRQDLSPLCRCLSSHADNEDRTFGLAECDRTALSIPSYQLRPVA